MLVAFGQDDELTLDLFDFPDTLLSLGSLRGLVAKLIDKYLHMGDVSLLGSSLCAHLLEIILALFEVRAVITGIGGDATVFERGNVIDARVHKGAVVTYDKHSAFVA